MLKRLRVRGLALLSDVNLEFGSGLNVLTGETGAGKSILVEAVGLLLGGRASGDLVRTGDEAASVEALFQRAMAKSPGDRFSGAQEMLAALDALGGDAVRRIGPRPPRSERCRTS